MTAGLILFLICYYSLLGVFMWKEGHRDPVMEMVERRNKFRTTPVFQKKVSFEETIFINHEIKPNTCPHCGNITKRSICHICSWDMRIEKHRYDEYQKLNEIGNQLAGDGKSFKDVIDLMVFKGIPTYLIERSLKHSKSLYEMVTAQVDQPEIKTCYNCMTARKMTEDGKCKVCGD